MVTVGFLEMLYKHFGVVVEVNNGKITNLYIERD